MEDFLRNEDGSNNNDTENNQNSNHSKVNYSNKNNADQIFEDFQFDRQYDVSYKPTKEEIKSFSDLQNGPSSLIQGASVNIQQVGIHNFVFHLNIEQETGKI